MRANRAEYGVGRLCRVLGVSRSGYYAWSKREPSKRALEDQKLSERIVAIHKRSRGTYGVPRIHAELADDHEIHIGRERISRLMRAEGIAGVSRRRGTRTTLRGEDAHVIPDLVERDFSADGPDQLWVADISYVPSWAGFLYLAIVLDVWSRRIVGWSMRKHLRTELVVEALEMALHQRRPEGVVHHSDQGCQYTSIAFGRRCRQAGIQPSTGSVGDCFDNAMAESFFASLECELIDRESWKTRTEARLAVFDYLEGWYNPHRRHSALGYLSPMAFEAAHEAREAA